LVNYVWYDCITIIPLYFANIFGNPYLKLTFLLEIKTLLRNERKLEEHLQLSEYIYGSLL